MTEWERIVADLRAAEDDMPRAVAACEALDNAADESRLPELHRLLTDDNDFFVREAAAVPIARLEGLHALTDLLRAHRRGTEDGHDNDGLSTLIADLISSARDDAAPLLLGMLADGSDERRSAAAWLLGFVSDVVTDPKPLLAALCDANSHVRAAAAGALASFAGRAGVFAGLVQALDGDTDEQVRVSAASALGFLGDKRALTALRRALADPAERVRYFAKNAISELEGSA